MKKNTYLLFIYSVIVSVPFAYLSCLYNNNKIELFNVLSTALLTIPFILLGLYCAKKTKLTKPISLKNLNLTSFLCFLRTSLSYSFLILILSKLILFAPALLSKQGSFLKFTQHIFFTSKFSWENVLLSSTLYGIIFRLILMSTFAWLLCKIKRTNFSMWIAIILSALSYLFTNIFFKQQLFLEYPNFWIYTVINSLLEGIILGYVYWKKGIYSSIITNIFYLILN